MVQATTIATRRGPTRDTGTTAGRTLYLSFALLVVFQLYWILHRSNHASISMILEVPDEPVVKGSKRINATGDELGDDSRPSTIEKHSPPIPRDNNSSQKEGAEESETAFQIPKNATLSKEDLELWKKHHLRHAHNHQKASQNVIANNKNDQEKRTVLFVHFHKAGGTSIVDLFKSEGYQLWNRQKNGIPFGMADKPQKNAGEEEPLIEDPLYDDPNGNVQVCQKYQFKKWGSTKILKFWMYSRSQFEAFLRDGESQIFWPYCLGDTTKDPQQVASDKGAEFVSLEWNFFTQDHFFEKDYLRQQAKMDIITVLRDPYDRFLSNFYFKFDNPKKNFDDPMEWSHLDLVRKKLSFIKQKQHKTHLPHYQYRELVPHDKYFSANYNKPNYYTAFLNGLAENTDDPGWESSPFDFEYFAFGLNQTHLEIAKQRLETMFDAVLILERPETHVQLDRWFAFLGDNTNRSYLPHHNKGQTSKATLQALNFTREEFYQYNALDKELYEYALELSLSKSVSKTAV